MPSDGFPTLETGSRARAFRCWLGGALAAVVAGSVAAAPHPAFVSIPGTAPRAGMLVRSALTAAELSAPQPVQFALKLRNFDELEKRVAHGEVISLSEMRNRYLPRPEDWRKVSTWAAAHGCSVEAEDPLHLTVFAEATVAQVQSSLHARFARVIGTDGQEHTSAVSAPEIPPELAGLLAGVHQLRPALRPAPSPAVALVATSATAGTLMLPETVAEVYDAYGLGYDGSGQTIVVLGAAQVNGADLTAFWGRCGLPTTLAQFTEVDPNPDVSPAGTSAALEPTMDIEWASAMAPKAKILYISSIDPATVCSLLLNRLATDPTIHQVTESYALSEASYAQANFSPATDTQYYAALAAVGITFFASSGDNGSNASFVNGAEVGTGGYDPDGVLAPNYPASDPNVTAVGGTALGFYGSNPSFSSSFVEGGWCLPDPAIQTVAGEPLNYGCDASTGGNSVFFSQPSWQAGAGGVAGGMRHVPDVAAVAQCSPSAFAYFDGGADEVFGGTSLSSPIWAGLCALINQARARKGLPPLGLLGPRIYPLMGGSSFHPLTLGSPTGETDAAYTSFSAAATNGAYGMGPDYNLVTGLGSPDVGNLIAALTAPTAPQITGQPASQTVAAGQSATFAVAAGADPAPAYQWFFDGAPIAGATASSYTIGTAATTDAGSYSVTVSNPGGSVSSSGAILAVSGNGAPAITTQPQSQTVAVGSTMALTVTSGALVSGGATSGAAVPDVAVASVYQWYCDGEPIAGANDPVLMIRNFGAANAGDYACLVSNPSGSTLSSAAALGAVATADPGRLINLSVEATVASGGQLLTIGFVSSGPGAAEAQNLLIRATGPALAAFKIPNFMPDPELKLIDGTGVPIAANAGWAGTAENEAAVGAADAAVGAYALNDPSSKDSATVVSVAPGAYTVQVASASGSAGRVLGEIYDDPAPGGESPDAPRLTNLSCRTLIATGGSLTEGFVIGGGTAKTVLIRVSGPALGAFGLTDAMPDPQLAVYNAAGSVIASDAGWGGLPEIAEAAGLVRAFAFNDPAGKDSAVVMTLAPGAYTVQASSVSGTAGEALIEVYVLP
ncbi:MAG: immunoglobulin domain-containing protein [Opitutaceae bacterium]